MIKYRHEQGMSVHRLLYPAPVQLKFEAFVSEAFPTCDILLAFGGIIYLLEPNGGGGEGAWASFTV